MNILNTIYGENKFCKLAINLPKSPIFDQVVFRRAMRSKKRFRFP